MKIKTAMPSLLVDGGIFKHLTILSDTDMTAPQMGVKYYFRSGEKTCNSLLEEYAKDGFSTEDEAFIGNMIDNFYGEDWKRQWDALMSDYNPIENYDRNEDTSDVNSGSDTDVYGAKTRTQGQQTLTSGARSDSAEHLSSAYDQSAYSPESKDINQTGAQSNTVGARTDSDGAHSDVHRKGTALRRTSRVHGNIGVTTTQQMIQSELELRKNNFYNIMMRDIDKFLALKCY